MSTYDPAKPTGDAPQPDGETREESLRKLAETDLPIATDAEQMLEALQEEDSS